MSEPSQWKQKYYDSLDEIERREKQWKDLEDLFKQAISRLTIAAEGNNESLDAGLAQLRTAIRKGKDNLTIERILDNVSKEIVKLDKLSQEGPTGESGFLLKIIEQLNLSGKSEKQSKRLIKQLNAKNPPEQNQLISEFSELLNIVVVQAVEENQKKQDKNNEGGFLKSLFGGSNKEHAREETGSEEPLPEPKQRASDKNNIQDDVEYTVIKATDSEKDVEEGPDQETDKDTTKHEAVEVTSEEPGVTTSQKSYEVKQDDDDQDEHESPEVLEKELVSVVATVQNVLESIIDGLDISTEVKEQLKDKVFEVKPTREIHVLLDDLKDILHGAGIEVPSRDLADTIGSTEHHELLIRLIEFLPLEEKVKAKAEKLKTNFSQGVSTEQLPQALKSIAELVSEMRSNVQQEQKEFEKFLKNLTGRLQAVDQYLKDNLDENQESYQNGIDLDNAVKEQVKGIGNSVASINNLEELESSIQQHLDQIINHIDKHRTQEDDRLARVKEKNQQLSEQLKQLETESSQLRRQVMESQSKALIDPLTQLPNRLAYDQRLKQEYARWKRYNSTLLIMVWDIDYFKSVNDTYGHQAGDKVLKVVANLLNSNLRETDFIARFGGEEFVSLMPETTLGGGFKVAEKIRASVEKLEFHYRGNDVKVTISCGISLFMENDTPDKAFARADDALYQAKSQGRNRCVIAKEP